jgi:hypothetical protein
MADGGIEVEDSTTLLADSTPATRLRFFAHILPRNGSSVCTWCIHQESNAQDSSVLHADGGRLRCNAE